MDEFARAEAVKILSGWKEIAQHLGRGVRTAQRWEQLGLPIHRPKGASRSSVFALKHELDAWASATPVLGGDPTHTLRRKIAHLEAENGKLRRELAQSRETMMQRSDGLALVLETHASPDEEAAASKGAA